jgi:hypothetical protein
VPERSSSDTITKGETGDRSFEEERTETPTTLREKQARMEQLVYRIWTCVIRSEDYGFVFMSASV